MRVRQWEPETLIRSVPAEKFPMNAPKRREARMAGDPERYSAPLPVPVEIDDLKPDLKLSPTQPRLIREVEFSLMACRDTQTENGNGIVDRSRTTTKYTFSMDRWIAVLAAVGIIVLTGLILILKLS